MTIRSYVTFEADFPDDSVWDDQENLVAPGGKVLAQNLINELECINLCCTSLQQHSFYGWAWELEFSSNSFHLVLQYPGPWLLICEPLKSITNLLFIRRRSKSFQELVQMLDEILKRNQHLTSVKWFTKEEFESNSTSNGSTCP